MLNRVKSMVGSKRSLIQDDISAIERAVTPNGQKNELDNTFDEILCGI